MVGACVCVCVWGGGDSMRVSMGEGSDWEVRGSVHYACVWKCVCRGQQ